MLALISVLIVLLSHLMPASWLSYLKRTSLIYVPMCEGCAVDCYIVSTAWDGGEVARFKVDSGRPSTLIIMDRSLNVWEGRIPAEVKCCHAIVSEVEGVEWWCSVCFHSGSAFRWWYFTVILVTLQDVSTLIFSVSFCFHDHLTLTLDLELACALGLCLCVACCLG